MIWLWVLLPLAPSALAVAIYYGFDLFAEDAAIVNVIVATFLTIVLVIPAIRQIDHNRDSAYCRNYGKNTGREVRYFTNGYWDYDCYVKTRLGWVRRDDVTETELRGGL